MLNESQNKTYQLIQNFLLDDSLKYLTLSAPAGYGKSYLLDHIQEQWKVLCNQRKFLQLTPLNTIQFASPTNKAASVLINAVTIHSLFGLSLRTNYKTGKVNTFTTSRTKDVGECLLVIDEASMIDNIILGYIEKYTSKAKIILVGDDHQLPPVGLRQIPAFTQGYMATTLTEPMRQDKNSHLFQQLQLVRKGVETQSLVIPEAGEGIRYLDANSFKQELEDTFRRQEDSRLLAYTNSTVEGYNGFLRQKLHNTDAFQVGDPVIAANRCDEKTSIEALYTIKHISPELRTEIIPHRLVQLSDGNTYSMPENKQEYFRMLKKLKAEAKDGDWRPYLKLKNNFLDIRDGYACTVNKSQGSTYNKVFIDLQNLCTCRDMFTLTRLIYVALSRAKTEVIIYRG